MTDMATVILMAGEIALLKGLLAEVWDCVDAEAWFQNEEPMYELEARVDAALDRGGE